MRAAKNWKGVQITEIVISVNARFATRRLLTFCSVLVALMIHKMRTLPYTDPPIVKEYTSNKGTKMPKKKNSSNESYLNGVCRALLARSADLKLTSQENI